MSNKTPVNKGSSFAGQVELVAKRKLRARRNPQYQVMTGLGMMGVVGWSVAMPTLIGASLGRWIDKSNPSSHSWTLALLVAGLVLGCLNAWKWVTKQEENTEDEDE